MVKEHLQRTKTDEKLRFIQVRDILERSTIAQTKKLLVSALMYLAVLSLPLGGILTLLRYAPLGFNVLPLRWYYK